MNTTGWMAFGPGVLACAVLGTTSPAATAGPVDSHSRVAVETVKGSGGFDTPFFVHNTPRVSGPLAAVHGGAQTIAKNSAVTSSAERAPEPNGWIVALVFSGFVGAFAMRNRADQKEDAAS